MTSSTEKNVHETAPNGIPPVYLAANDWQVILAALDEAPGKFTRATANRIEAQLRGPSGGTKKD